MKRQMLVPCDENGDNPVRRCWYAAVRQALVISSDKEVVERGAFDRHGLRQLCRGVGRDGGLLGGKEKVLGYELAIVDGQC